MAYNAKNLSRMGGIPYKVGAGASLYGYVNDDTLAVIAASGYFNSATNRLRKGDMILVSGSVSGTPEIAMLTVTSATGAATVTTKASVTSGKIAAGRATTVTASDTIVTGLASLVAVVVSLDDNPGDNPMLASGSIGDQAGAPAAGSFLLKTWQNTSGSDPTPVAATTFSKKVNWIAFGA